MFRICGRHRSNRQLLRRPSIVIDCAPFTSCSRVARNWKSSERVKALGTARTGSGSTGPTPGVCASKRHA
eukprot:6689048-Prymnesium_polylepis.2